MILALVLAALSYANVVEVWHILVLAALLGLVNAVDMPTRQSFVVEMVGREDVANAVGLNSAIFNLARIVGPAVGGILIGVLGVTACFFVNGLSYVAVIAGLLMMRDAELRPATLLSRPTSVARVRSDLADGLGYVRRTPIVLLAVSLVGLVSTFGMNFNVLIPDLAQNVLGVGATGLGFMMASMGVGALAAALAVGSMSRPRVRVLLVGAFALGVLQVVLGVVHSYPVALVAMFGAGAGAIAMTVSANTAIQLAVPDALRGRVLSVYTTVFAGSTPIGGPLIGALASAFGTSAALATGGVLSALTAVVAAAWVVRGGSAAGLRSGLSARRAAVGAPAGRPVSAEGPRPGS
jgi:MFS family permease